MTGERNSFLRVLFAGMCVQAMDTASVCLVSMELGQEGFDPYRCDKNINLGVNLAK